MSDNRSAFSASGYDRKIRQVLPYYEEFYRQVVELVKVLNQSAVRWLDIGCGTGEMGRAAFENVEIEQFVFCDSSDEMIKIAKERFAGRNAKFFVCDFRELVCAGEFDVITSIQVNHYLRMEERREVLLKCHEALKEHGPYIGFENFAPFTDLGKAVYLEKWKRYQMKQGRSPEECEEHLKRYGRDYFPISLSENMELLRNCGFQAVEILWLSNMQAGLWGIK